jgi:hypothetical protein
MPNTRLLNSPYPALDFNCPYRLQPIPLVNNLALAKFCGRQWTQDLLPDSLHHFCR